MAVQSLTPLHALAITGLGDKHADCPILATITVPEFVTLGQAQPFDGALGVQGCKGFPDQQVILPVLPEQSHRLAIGANTGAHNWFIHLVIPV